MELFSERQKKIIASSLTLIGFSVIVSFAALVVWFLIRIVTLAAPALIPVIFGMFLALLFKPYYLLCLRYVKKPSIAVIIVLLSVLLPVGTAMWYFGAFLLDQIITFTAQAPALYAKTIGWIHTTYPRLQALADTIGIPYQSWFEVSKYKATEFGLGLLSSLTGLFSWVVAMVFFVYFLTRPAMRGEDYVKELPMLKTQTKSFVANQINAFLDIIINFFRRQIIICFFEGIFYGLGFTLVSLPYGFIIGFLLGVLNLIPFFGSITCLAVALPLAYLGVDGSLMRLVLVLCVWIIGQFLDGYVITPRIQGNSTGLGYAGVIFSFIFWGLVFHSLLGLLLAIPLSAFCVVLWRALKSTYIHPVV